MANPFEVCAGIVTGATTLRQVTVANATGAGDTLLAVVVVNNTTCTVSGVTDSKGNVYTLDKSFTTTQPTVYAFRSPGATGGSGGGPTVALATSDTVNVTTVAVSGNVEIFCIDAPGAGAVDQIATIATGSSATPSVSATPGHANEICVSYFGTANAGGSPAVNAPFTSLGTPLTSGSNPYTTAAYDVLSGGSGVAQTSTLTIVSGNWRAGMWTFQPGAGTAYSIDVAQTVTAADTAAGKLAAGLDAAQTVTAAATAAVTRGRPIDVAQTVTAAGTATPGRGQAIDAAQTVTAAATATLGRAQAIAAAQTVTAATTADLTRNRPIDVAQTITAADTAAGQLAAALAAAQTVTAASTAADSVGAGLGVAQAITAGGTRTLSRGQSADVAQTITAAAAVDVAPQTGLVPGTPFVPGGVTNGTGQVTGIGHVLAANGVSTYGSTWSGPAQTSATQTVALAAAEPYLVGTQVGLSGSGTVAVNVDTVTEPGDLIAVEASVGSNTVAPTGVTDDAGNTYALAGEVTGNSLCTYIYAATATAPLAIGQKITIAWNATTNNKNCRAIACGGVDDVSVTDISTSALTTTASTSPSVTSGSLARAAELAVAVVACQNAGASITWPAGWTAQGTAMHAGTGLWSSVATQIESDTAPVTAAATLGAPATWSVLLITFKAAAAGGGTGALAFTTASLPAATVGVAYSAQLQVTNDNPPDLFAILTGGLPPGLQLGTGGGGGGGGSAAIARAGVSASYTASAAGNADGTGVPTLADWNTAAGVLGSGMTMSKLFFSAALPPSWTDSTNALVKALCDQIPGFFPVLCWNSNMTPAALQAYLSTIPADQTVGFCWQQEPELSGMTPANFLTDPNAWNDQAAVIKGTGRANLLLVHAAAGVAYAGTQAPGWGGAFLPRPQFCDIYAIDTYQHEKGGAVYGVTTWPANGLATAGWSFANWLALVQPFGKQIGITEYGVDFGLSDPAKRNSRLQADLAYLLGAFGGGPASPQALAFWMYWYRNMATAGDLTKAWRFTDAPTIATWQQVIAATASAGASSGSSGGGFSGQIFGTPTTAGTFPAGYQVTDSAGNTATASLPITVGTGSPQITTTTLPAGATGADYDAFVQVAGGLAPLTLAVTNGVLPAGLALGPATGEITGTFASNATSQTFDVTVTDSQTPPQTDTQTLTITVSASLAVATTSLPDGVAGVPYTRALTATGGAGGNTWSILIGSLPNGYTLTSGGTISGTTGHGTKAFFTAKVTDSAGATATMALSITVAGASGRPVSAGFLRAISGTHQMAVRATLLTTFQTGTTPAGIDLPVIDGDVVLDGTAQIRGTLDMTTDGTGWDRRTSPIRPYGAEVYVERGVDHDGSTEWVGLGYYKLYGVEQQTAPGNPLRLTGQDRMALIIDGRLPAPVQFTAAASVAEVFTQLVTDIYPGAVFSFDWNAAADLLGAPQVTQDDRYGFLADLATSRGKIMHFDHRGILVVKDAPDPGTPVWSVAGGAGGVLVTADRTLSRDGVYNAIVAQAVGANSSSPPWALAYDNNPDSPTYYFGPFGKVPAFYSSPLLVTASQCETAAKTMLARISGLPYQVDFTAVPNPAMQPFDPVLISYAGTADDDIQVIMSITIPFTPDAAIASSTREQGALQLSVTETALS